MAYLIYAAEKSNRSGYFLIKLSALILLIKRYEVAKLKFVNQYCVLIAIKYYIEIIYSESLSDGLYF